VNTIKNYLESMFANMPNTPEVIKAKNELWQMMEDKYNELISDGKSENEAVGTVIAEFGNLEEIAADLGLKKEFEQEQRTQAEAPRRKVSLEEAKAFLHDKSTQAMQIAIGVFLCITCVTSPIIMDAINLPGAIGVTGMFAMIAVAVVLFVLSGQTVRKWDFMKRELCSIDYATAQEINSKRENYGTSRAVCLTVGILLIVLSWIPAMLIDEFSSYRGGIIGDITGASLFVFVGIGVMLIIISSKNMEAFEKLLKLNDTNTVSGNYEYTEENVVYINPTVQTIMEIYWPTITSIYLIVSFLTFNWFSTWIIWPVAGIVHSVLKKNLRK